MITRDTTLIRSTDVLFAQVGSQEGVMLSVEQGCYYSLNPVASRICELIETPKTVGELVDQLCAEFVVDRAIADTEVLAFVNTLISNGVVQTNA